MATLAKEAPVPTSDRMQPVGAQGPPRPEPADAELIVLAVLAEGEQYGYAISKAVAVRSGDRLTIGPGVLYPLLSRLERSGMVASRWDGGPGRSEAAPGRRRKWYRLSAKGRRRLDQRIAAHRARHALFEAFIGGSAPEAGA